MNSDFWKDMVAAIDHNYKTSAFKGMPFMPNIRQYHLLPISNGLKRTHTVNKKTQLTQYFLFQTKSFILCFGQQVVHNLTHYCFEKKCSLRFSCCVGLLVTVLVRMC